MTIAKDLQVISRQLKKLVKQTEKLTAAFEKTEKSKVKSIKSKTKASTVSKKAPVRGNKKSDTAKVLAMIKRSKKGVDTAALMRKTGFDQKKIRNILHRSYKKGTIIRVEKGIYVGAK